MHDFASISLSDLLTPWELIEKRLEAAASADFVIVLYNPKSKGRPDHINRARDIILNHRPSQTPVGIVMAATRENEQVVITDLAHMLEHEIDMQSTVIIGNSQTFVLKDRMVTPRGYREKCVVSILHFIITPILRKQSGVIIAEREKHKLQGGFPLG
jgi:precorrin-3B C17-methyltransferase